MDPIYGFYDTEALIADERPGKFREGILKIRPNGKAPFLALTAALKTDTTDDPEFKWFSSKIEDRRLKITTALTSSATTLACSGGGALSYPAGSLFRVEHTGELIEVVSNPTSDTALTISRGVAGTTPTAVTITADATNPYVHYIGTALEEGSVAPPPVAKQTAEYYNYCQIQRNTYGATRTLKTMNSLRTGKTEARIRSECLETHSEALDDQFLFGTRATGLQNGRRRLLSGGMKWFVETYAAGNKRDFSTINSGSLDMETLEEELYKIFRWNAGEMMMICGMGVLKVINQVARKNTAYTTYTNEKMLGLSVTTLVTPYGTLVAKTHPRWSLFTGGTSGSTPAAYYSLENAAMIFPPSHISVRKKDYDMQHEENLQAPGTDGFQSGFISNLGLELHHPEAFFWWEKVANPAKDS